MHVRNLINCMVWEVLSFCFSIDTKDVFLYQKKILRCVWLLVTSTTKFGVVVVTRVSNCGPHHVMQMQHCCCGSVHSYISPQLRCDLKLQKKSASQRPQRNGCNTCIEPHQTVIDGIVVMQNIFLSSFVFIS